MFYMYAIRNYICFSLSSSLNNTRKTLILLALDFFFTAKRICFIRGMFLFSFDVVEIHRGASIEYFDNSM